MHFARLANTLLKDEESARDNHVLACNFAKYSPILKLFFFADRLGNESFTISLLTTPPPLKCVAALPCTLPLTARFLAVMFRNVCANAAVQRYGGDFQKTSEDISV